MAYGVFREVTTLELFQHHFSKSGHGDYLLMTRQLTSTDRQPPFRYLTRSVRRTSGFVLTGKQEGTELLLVCRPSTNGRCRIPSDEADTRHSRLRNIPGHCSGNRCGLRPLAHLSVAC